MNIRTIAFALAAAGTLAAVPALASSQISPSEPYEFDLVNLRMTVDSCTFAPETVSVSAADGTIRVAHRLNNCLVPGEPRVVDIRLGTLPVGQYRVEVHLNGDPGGPSSENIAFAVNSRPQIAVFPPPPRPLTDYSGHWFRPSESGWGLSFQQSPTNVVFATWYVYDDAGRATWFAIQNGQWVSSTKWSGTVYRTTGPHFFAPTFDPALVTIAPTGLASFEFEQRPGEIGFATFTYESLAPGGHSGSKRITRLAF